MISQDDKVIPTADILVVDDTIENLKLLREILTKAGFRSRLANGPQSALESAMNNPPGLILLDVRMPEMDGFEVCRRLKQDERTCDIPIMFISALQDTEDRVQGFEVGGVDFISKPFQEAEVLARVKTHLQLRAMQLHLEERVAERTTELQQAYNELHDNEERFRSTFEQAAVGIAHVSKEGRFLLINQRFCEIVGYSHREMLKLTFQKITHPDDLANDLEHMQQLLDGKTDTYSMEKRYIHKQGDVVWVNLTVSLLRKDSGEPRWFVSVVEDIRARKQAEQQLQAYQRRLKALATQLTVSEEQERRRIAADLHDHVGHALALARMQLHALHKAKSHIETTLLLNDLSKLLLKAIQDTKSLIFDLSAPTMNEIGLAAAISGWLEEYFGHRYSIETELIDNSSGDRVLESNLRAILFRNVRELLTNVIKHACAQKVTIVLDNSDECVRIHIKDDGRGFNPERALQNVKPGGGFGLFSIQERLTDLGGALEILSKPGRGCEVIMTTPFERN